MPMDRSLCLKYLASIGILVLEMAIVLAIVITAMNFRTKLKEMSYMGVSAKELNHSMDYCSTTECVIAAATFLNAVNFSRDPCEDFYNFACGQFEADSVIKEDATVVSRFSEITDSLNARLLVVLEAPKQDHELSHFQKAKDLYSACMDTARIDELGAKPLVELLDRVGGWPLLLEQWDESKFDWKEFMVKLRNQGMADDSIIAVYVMPDMTDPSTNIVDLGQSKIGLAREYLLKGFDDPLVQEYYKYYVSVALKTGPQVSKEKVQKELEECVRFEIQLAELTAAKEEYRNQSAINQYMDLRQLAREVPEIEDWVGFIGSLLPVKIIECERVQVGFISALKKILKLANGTSKRILANYMIMRGVDPLLDYLDKDYREFALRYSAFKSGVQVESPRRKTCLYTVNSEFGNALGALYIRDFFNEGAKDIALEMVQNIRQEFGEIMDGVGWMDSVTRQRAKDKLGVIEQVIGYPPELKDENLLEEYFADVIVDPQQYFRSIVSSFRYWTHDQLGKLRTPIKRIDWARYGAVATVNAYFYSEKNLIVFPAGILQGAFFNAQRPKYVNYGSIGSVIGHELTHGFDDQGRQLDQTGAVKDWWDPETAESFDRSAKCIIEQYGNYAVPDGVPNSKGTINLNGINTQGENIADNGGVKQAYGAYQKWAIQNGPEFPLPGFQNYTVNQLFWISFANIWCGKIREKSLASQAITDPHSPKHLRVIGVVSNSPDFARDFNCPTGSPMNPVNKCAVW